MYQTSPNLRQPRLGAEYSVDGPLWGRERELGKLSSFFEQATENGGAILITGEAGIGRTTLLSLAARRAAENRGARLLRAVGLESETHLRFGSLHQLLLPVLGTLHSLPNTYREALSVALGTEKGYLPTDVLLATSLLAWFRHLSLRAPVIVMFDDLQNSDPASADLLTFVARRVDGMKVAMAFAERSGPAVSPGRWGIRELSVSALLPAEADSVLQHQRIPFHRSVRRRLVEAAAGNPLALAELPRGLSPAQKLGRDPLPDTIPMTDRLRSVFVGRLQALPESTLELLLQVALNAAGEVAVSAIVRDRDTDLKRAEDSGMLHIDAAEQRLRFAHPLLEAAVVEFASASQRRAAHAELARLSTDELHQALHRGEAVVGVDEVVAHDLAAAAITIAGRGDTLRAIAVLIRAAELSRIPLERARRLAQAAYLGSQVSGNMDGAQAMLERARMVDPHTDENLESATAAASHLVQSVGGVDAAHRILVAALDSTTEFDVDVDSLEAAMSTLLLVCQVAGREDFWARYAEVVARFEARLPAILVVSATSLGSPARATNATLAELDALIAQADLDPNPVRVLQAALAGLPLDRVPRRGLERVVEDARAGGAVATGAACLTVLAAHAVAEGRWDEARRLADECVNICQEQGLGAIEWAGLHPLMYVAACRGDRATLHLAADRRRASRAGAVGTQPSFDANIEAQLAMAEGRFHDAFELFSSIASPGTFPASQPVALWTVLDVVESSLRAGRTAEARRHVRASLQLGLPRLSPRLRFLTHAASAFIASDDRYEEAFDGVLSNPEGGRWPFYLARVELTYGDRLRHSREIRRARPHLERAAVLFAELGAEPWRERAVASLRATGQTRRRADPYASAVLTPKEEEIARLAARGLSNKEIGGRLYLSARTVSGHLYRIFPKLGITTRAALRDALTENSPAEGEDVQSRDAS